MSPSEDLLVTQADLIPPVRWLLGSDQVEVLTWEAQPIGYAHINPITGGICRVSGTALIANGRVGWSLVLKILHQLSDAVVQQYSTLLSWSEADIALFSEGWLWDREAHAYSSLLPDLRGSLRAPRCFGVIQKSVDERWLWLEDIADVDVSLWSLDDFAGAARAIGTLSGAYQVEHPVPAANWLNRRWLRIWSTVAPRAAIQLIQRPETWQQPAIRRAFPVPIAERLLRLSGDIPALLDHLDALPRTLCHHDAFRPNLLMRRNATQDGTIVAVDWAFMGIGAIGEDVGQLLAASLLWNEADIARAPELEGAIFEGYLNGLRDAGWGGDPLLARQGFALSAVVRWGIHAPRLYEAPGSVPDFVASRDDGRSPDEIIAQRAAVAYYLLDLADRTRRALDSV